jgi:hypothetical protein
MSEIKSEVKTMKTAVENLAQKFEQINMKIDNIKSNNTITENKVKIIENELLQIKQNQNVDYVSSIPPPLMQEKLILELKDRNEREKHIIIVGIVEKNDTHISARRSYDESEVTKLISSLCDNNCPKPIKIIRLGKFIPNKNRAIKVFFDNTNTRDNYYVVEQNFPKI